MRVSMRRFITLCWLAYLPSPVAAVAVVRSMVAKGSAVPQMPTPSLDGSTSVVNNLGRHKPHLQHQPLADD